MTLEAWPNRSISLARYARLLDLDECAFWGVHQDTQPSYACGAIWTQWQRREMAQVLAQAESMIEDVVGYPVAPTWITGTPEEQPDFDQRWVDVQRWRQPLLSRWGYVIAPGIKATETIAAGAEVNLSTDPATVGPLAVSFPNADEVKVYYPGSQREITPSQVEISGGSLTVTIPKCRLVNIERINNDEQGNRYSDADTFQQTVDVRREYADDSTNGILVAPNRDPSTAAYLPGAEWTDTASIQITNHRLGVFLVNRAKYSGGAWGKPTACPRAVTPTVRLYYRAGLVNLSEQMEWSIIRLAHSLLPEEPCGCVTTLRYWRRDRQEPKVVTRERLNCPFGLSDGAWVAYRFALAQKLTRAKVWA